MPRASRHRNAHKEERTCCYFHPKQVVVGVCPLCLNERLLILAAKQDHHRHHHHHRLQSSTQRKPSASIHKIFAFGSLFTRHQFKSHYYDQDDASPSPEDSFISIKFEENGVASWEKSSLCNMSNKVCVEGKVLEKEAKENKSVIEHGKSNNAFRWRKRMGRLVHFIQWKRSSKGGVGHVSNNVEGVKVRKGWMRTLTKRKTVE